MKEVILVEFIAGLPIESSLLLKKLSVLPIAEFCIKNSKNFSKADVNGNYVEWIIVTGEITSAYATIVKLQDPFLAERMRISYIPNELKDKYRR